MQIPVADTGTTSLDRLVAVLCESLRTVAATGRSDEANRLAGRAYAALRREHPTQAQQINVLMHKLARIPNTIEGTGDAPARANRPAGLDQETNLVVAGSMLDPEAAADVWLSPRARERLVFLPVAGVMIVTGGLVAAVNGATPFAHGSWLAAYLVLVGGVAQLALGIGCLLMPRAVRSRTLRRVQLALWNLGTLTVAGGVLANLFGAVLTGSIVVAAALASFAGGSGPARDPGRRRVIVYRVTIGLLAISVVIGGVLAHGTTTG